MPDTGALGGLPTRRPPSPYHASLDTPLLDFGGEVWDIRAACQAVCIQGAPGSAKSSASAKAIRKAALQAGMGGWFACAKIEEAATLIADIKEAGREADLVLFDATAQHRFNILDFAAKELGGPGFEGNIVEMMRRMSEAISVASDQPASDSGENKYFVDNAMKWLSHAFPLLLLVEGTLRLRDVNEFIATSPKTPEELRSPKWQRGYCSQVHIKAAYKSRENTEEGRHALRVINDHGVFFLREAAELDARPRSGIVSNITNLIYPFLTGKLNELFCQDTTVTPQDCRDGKLIIMDLPVLKYGMMGAVAQSLFKYLFGMSMQSRPVDDETRPVLLYMDECQNFLSTYDADLLAMSRSAKICPVFITQDQPTFFAKMDEENAKSLLGKFGTRIFHANLSYETNLAASELIGKVQKFHVGETQSTTVNSGGGGNVQDGSGGYSGQKGEASVRGQSSSGYMDYEIPPDYFATQLRTGTKVNNYKADAIVVRGNRNWKRTGRHWIKAEFSQR